MRDIANSKMEYPYLRVELERSAVEVARSVLTGGGKPGRAYLSGLILIEYSFK